LVAPHGESSGYAREADAGPPYTRRNEPMDPRADDATDVQPTIDYTPPTHSEPPRPAPTTLTSASEGGGASPRVEVVAGSGVHLSEETRSLLRVRLRAVALAMSCAFGAFLVRGLWLAGHYLDPFL